MRTGWQLKSLSEIATHSLGKMLDKEKNKGDPKPYLRNFNVRWFDFDLSDVQEMRFQKEERERYSVVKGDLIICEGGYPGRAAIWDKDESVYFQKALHRVRFHEPARARWLLYYLYMKDLDGSLKSHFNGTGIQHLTGEALAQFKMPLPPLGEQRAIVAILDVAFEGIATAKANAEKNIQNARAIFESQLQSVFTERGKTWKRRTLEEIATTFGRGKSKHRPRNAPHLYGGKYPFVQTGDIRNADHIITGYSQTYSEAGLAQSKLWPKGTICITIAANIAETAILGFDACFPDSIIGVVANPKEADVGFIEYLLQSFKVRIQAMGKGSAQANINMGTFENEQFPFPSVNEQQRIVAELDGLSGETQRLDSIYERKLAALEALKKSLLHSAFSGALTAQKAAARVEAAA
jgi:type I restriction enzyme S subunit